ncbi:kelch repeat and BTB domain-containing protein 8-like [Leptodactylus fuscus]|uniref:kelch repeat and BTB domain-containing protein 8-like n=1 Tax=Leptodactylus fuscus TaxID=238119 RepID=UPI003F4F0445
MEAIVEDYEEDFEKLEKSIMKGLQELYLSKTLCDATVVTEGERFLCHKVVLSTVSPYFRVLFTCPMKESESGEVSLLDIPSSVMKDVLNFVYTGRAKLNMDNVEDLFMVSCRLQIKPLQDFCSRFLILNMDSENCLWIYRLAHSHNDHILLDISMHCIGQNLTSIAEKEDFLHLELSEVTSILSSDELMVSSEFTIYSLACRWWENNSDSGSPLPEGLVKVIRFPLMNRDELSKVSADVRPKTTILNSPDGRLRQGMYEERILSLDLTERYETIPGLHDYHVNAYDPNTDSWEKLPFISPPYDPGVVAVSTSLFVSGGFSEDDYVSKLLHVYDSITNEWKELPSMINPRYGHGFLHYREFLYAVGGYDGQETINSAERFNLINETWSSISSIPLPVRSFPSAVLKGKLFLLGGLTGPAKQSTPYQGFHIYDIATDTWSQFELPVVFSGAGAVVLDDKLYVIASYDSRHGDCHAYPPYDEYQAYLLYDEQPNTTPRSFCMDHLGRICQSAIPPVLESIVSATVVAWKHRIYIIGGSGRDGLCHEKMFYWNTGTPKWIKCEKDLPFSYDGSLGGVTLLVPMKRFHGAIPRRKLSYNFRSEDHDQDHEEQWWKSDYSL